MWPDVCRSGSAAINVSKQDGCDVDTVRGRAAPTEQVIAASAAPIGER
ncbi:MAG: hypothetical protein ACRCWJ_04635 [Casimicrobium sp.]